jgi:hypothetical protein
VIQSNRGGEGELTKGTVMSFLDMDRDLSEIQVPSLSVPFMVFSVVTMVTVNCHWRVFFSMPVGL